MGARTPARLSDAAVRVAAVVATVVAAGAILSGLQSPPDPDALAARAAAYVADYQVRLS